MCLQREERKTTAQTNAAESTNSHFSDDVKVYTGLYSVFLFFEKRGREDTAYTPGRGRECEMGAATFTAGRRGWGTAGGGFLYSKGRQGTV
jgi:hypothetical protein